MVYYALAELGLMLVTGPAPTMTIWPPAGLAVAVCLVWGRRCWPGLFFGALGVQLDVQDVDAGVIPIALGETLAPVLAASVIPHPGRVFRRVRQMCRFICIAVLGAPCLGAGIGVVGQWLIQAESLPAPMATWGAAWLAHAAGVMVVAPGMLALFQLRHWPGINPEAVTFWLLSVLLSLVIFSGWQHPETARYPMVFLMVPLVTWAGFRYSSLVVSAVLATMVMIATVSTVRGHGPFFQALLPVSLFLLETYILVIGGTVLAMHALVVEHAESKEELHNSQSRLQAILDTAPDGIVTVDSKGRIESFNQAASLMFGYAPDEIIGQSLNRLIPPPKQDKSRCGSANPPDPRVSSAQCRFGEVRGLRKDGTIFPLEFTLSGFDGHSRGFTGIIRDISARLATLNNLRDSQQRLELALIAADLGIWDWQVQTGQAIFSERWTTMLGYGREEMAPTYASWEHLLHPDDKLRVQLVLQAHLAGETPYYESEFRMMAKDGQWKWILARGKVLERGPAGRPLRALGIHSDISGRKALEERLRQLQEELLYTHRLTTAGELAATMAHELNQPLAAISGYLTGIDLRFNSVLNENPELAQAIRDTQRLTQRAAEVVVGIRDLVRKQEVRMEWLGPASLLELALSVAQSELLQRRVEVNRRIAPALPRIRGQRILLQQLLVNLILNAMEAMDRVETGRRRLTVEARQVGERQLEISISDTGPGIPREIAGHLFDPFVSGKPKGIGLGLSICRSIAEAHGGWITARKPASGETTFSLTLPVEAYEHAD